MNNPKTTKPWIKSLLDLFIYSISCLIWTPLGAATVDLWNPKGRGNPGTEFIFWNPGGGGIGVPNPRVGVGVRNPRAGIGFWNKSGIANGGIGFWNPRGAIGFGNPGGAGISFWKPGGGGSSWTHSDFTTTLTGGWGAG